MSQQEDFFLESQELHPAHLPFFKSVIAFFAANPNITKKTKPTIIVENIMHSLLNH